MQENDSSIKHRFQTDGYVVVRNAVSEKLLQPVRDLINRNVDIHAQKLKSEGKINSTHSEASFERRLALIYNETESRMRSWNSFLFSQELFQLVRDNSILDVIEQLAGKEISFNGDYHLRPKLPGSTITALPLHQDSQYYGFETGKILIISVWVPLVDVDENNGCLCLIPGSHNWGLLKSARRADSNMVSTEDVEQRGNPVAVPMKCGDLIAFHNLTFHGSKVNNSSNVRWSVDFRFRETPGYRKMSTEEQEGHAVLEGELERSAQPPLVVRSSNPKTIGDYTSWEAARLRLKALKKSDS